MRQRRARCLRSIISIPAVNLCAPLKAQLWGDVIRCVGQRVSSAGKLSQAGKRTGASVAGAVPWLAPPCRTRRAGEGAPSWNTDKVEGARAGGAMPAAVVDASPAVAAGPTLAVVAAEAVAEVVQAAAVVEAVAVADTTNPLSRC